MDSVPYLSAQYAPVSRTGQLNFGNKGLPDPQAIVNALFQADYKEMVQVGDPNLHAYCRRERKFFPFPDADRC
jgi:hypothetical protein